MQDYTKQYDMWGRRLNDQSLYDYLAQLLGMNTAQANYPEQYQEWVQDQIPTPQKTTRPIVMPYSEYKQQYMPMQNMIDAYEEHVDPIRNSDWRDNDPTYRYLRDVKSQDEFDSQMRKRQ